MNIFKNICLAFIAFVFVVSTADIHAKRRRHPIKHVSLFVGLYQDIKIPHAPTRFGRKGTYKKCAKLQFNPKEKILRINPTRVNDCSLFITDKKTGNILYEFRLDVKKTNVAKTAKEIQGLLRDIEGIKVKILNGRVVVDGEVILPSDISRIFSVVNQYGGDASSLVRLSPMAQVKIARYMERAINNPEISVKAVNGIFLLEGFANSKDEKDRAFILAQAYLPDQVTRESDSVKLTKKLSKDKIINLINVKAAPAAAPKKIIQVVVHFVELNKDYQKGFSFQWTPGLGSGDQSKIGFTSGSRGPSSIASTITGVITNLLPKLNWAKSHGHARELQSASIVVQDGKQGVINSTSKIPYVTANENGAPKTEFADTGISTNITPEVLGERSDSIKLSIKFSVKALAGYAGGAPLVNAKDINTTLVVRSGQSAAIGGLVSSTTSTGYNKAPPGNNPIISLMASKDFQRKQSQFVVFLTPIIKSSASAGAEQIKRKFRLKN